MPACGPGDGVSGGAESCAGLRMSQGTLKKCIQLVERAIAKALGHC